MGRRQAKRYICQRFARRNRERMAEIILERTGMSAVESFHTIHNYIDAEEMILRKGAIAVHAGEKVLIPINMRDGSVLARGKGNPEWNYSAPHGAGRVMSRTMAKRSLNLEDYKAPMAYKSLEIMMSDLFMFARRAIICVWRRSEM